MGSNSKWVFLKSANRIPTMFGSEASHFRSLQRSYAQSRDSFREYLDYDFRKQTREIKMAAERAGLDIGGVHIQFVSQGAGPGRNVTEAAQPRLAVTIYNIKSDKDAVERFGQNLFDARAHNAGGNLQWTFDF